MVLNMNEVLEKNFKRLEEVKDDISKLKKMIENGMFNRKKQFELEKMIRQKQIRVNKLESELNNLKMISKELNNKGEYDEN